MAPLLFLGALLLTALVCSPARADTLLYADHLAVYDSTGRQVGSAWPGSTQTDFHYVSFRRGSTAVIVRVRPDGFFREFLRFPEPGCTGQPLMDALWGELYRYAAVVGPRATVYVQSGTVRVRTSRSTMTDTGQCNDHDPIRDFAVPVTSTEVNLDDHFVPPFTTRTRARTVVPLTAP